MSPPRSSYDLTGADHDYPVWAGAPQRSVLIATHPRSGSSLLGEALYFAGGLGCPLEYFHHGFRPGLAARWGTGTLSEHVAAVHRLRTDPSGTLGVKLFWTDVEAIAAELAPGRFGTFQGHQPGKVAPETYRDLAALLAPIFPNPAFVHLERTDRVRQAVSGLTASQTGRFRIVDGADPQPAKGVADYDFERIDTLVAWSDYCHGHWRNFFAAIGAAPLTLTYEALTADYAGSVRCILDGLGSSAPVPPVRMGRQSDALNEAFVLRYLRDRQAAGS